MARKAGTLIAGPARPGATASEIVDLAVVAAKAGIAWTTDGCAAFAWGISNLAGLPFFDLANRTYANDPRSPLDIGYVVPHARSPNMGGDGWELVSSERSVSALSKILKPGDIVRVYAAGNSGEATEINDKPVAHSFIVVSNKNGDVQVVDNWSGGIISQHSLSVIAKAFAPSGSFGAAYVSRIDSNWVASHLDRSIQGEGYGNWSGFVDSTAPVLLSSNPADNAGKVAVGSDITLNFSEKVVAGSGKIEIYEASGKRFETLDVHDSRVEFSGSTVTIDPKNFFAPGKGYYVMFNGGVIKDAAGNGFGGITSKATLNFTTIKDTSPPKLESASPADNANKVSKDANITLEFNEKVLPGDGYIEIRSSDGKVFEKIDVDSSQVRFQGDTVTINPNKSFAAGKDYYVIIRSGVIIDEAGNEFAGWTSKTKLNFTVSSSRKNEKSNEVDDSDNDAASTATLGVSDILDQAEDAFLWPGAEEASADRVSRAAFESDGQALTDLYALDFRPTMLEPLDRVDWQ